MPSTSSPRRPLPARVYWTRRLVVLGTPLLLVVVLARVLGGSSDGKDAGQDGTAAQVGASMRQVTQSSEVGPTAKAGARGRRGKKGKQQQPVVPVEPVLAEPTGPCTESDIVVTPAITAATGGLDVIPITLNLRTVVSEACTWHVSASTLTVTITSGSDHIWSSRECPRGVPEQDVVVRSAVDVPVVVSWQEGRYSNEGCVLGDWARPGFYHVEAAAIGGEATDVQFELIAPTAPVITKTAEPEQQGGKGGKKNPDKSHQPGEDGDGNSEG